MRTRAAESGRRSRYANITSTLALVVALGGTSYAATQVPAHSVGTKQLKTHAVTTPKIAAGAVGSRKIATHSVSHAKIALNAVTGAKVATDSLSLADLVGADVRQTISVSAGAVPPHSCTTFAANAPGAQVGQAILLTFIGNVPAPPGLTFQPIKISSPGQYSLRFCNPTNVASPAFTNVGVRVVTFG
jgi:hypothetical protein